MKSHIIGFLLVTLAQIPMPIKIGTTFQNKLRPNGHLPNQLIINKAKKIERNWHLNCILSPAEVDCASLLAASGHLPRQVITTRAERIARNWSQPSHIPSPAEVNFTASLAANGHLPCQILTDKAEDVHDCLHLPSRALSSMRRNGSRDPA